MTTATKPSYSYWRDALAGKKPTAYVDQPELGFYRKGVYRKEPNKRATRVGWTPVAIYIAGGALTAAIGGINDRMCQILIDRDQIAELWSFVSANPISEEWYRVVAEQGGAWPDSHDASSVPPPIAETIMGATEPSSSEKIAAAVKADGALTGGYQGIDSDEMASRARSLQNSLLGHRSAAEKAYNEENRPLLDRQKELRGIWFPIRDEADAHIKTLAKEMGKWEDTKREAARRAQAEADKAAREHAEAVRKAEAANKPAPPAPPKIEPNTPAPAAQIRGGAGRAASVTVQKFVTAIDAAKVFEQFKGNAEVLELLTALAQKAVRAGLDVPGATVEERSIVR